MNTERARTVSTFDDGRIIWSDYGPRGNGWRYCNDIVASMYNSNEVNTTHILAPDHTSSSPYMDDGMDLTSTVPYRTLDEGFRAVTVHIPNNRQIPNQWEEFSTGMTK